MLLFASPAFAKKEKKNSKSALKAPDFTITLSTGETKKISDYQGKAVLLHFWATWCPPCILELPGMNALAEKLESQGEQSQLDFLAICISDTEENRSNFMKKNGYTFPGGLDESGKIAARYGIQGVPTSILISPQGEILDYNVGMMTEAQLAQFVRDYVE